MMNQGRFHIVASGTWVPGGGGGAWLAGSQQRGFVAAVVRNGAGDYTFSLQEAFDAMFTFIFCTKRGALVASQLCSFGVVHTDDIQKQITIIQEDAGGAISIPTDAVPFDILVVYCAP